MHGRNIITFIRILCSWSCSLSERIIRVWYWIPICWYQCLYLGIINLLHIVVFLVVSNILQVHAPTKGWNFGRAGIVRCLKSLWLCNESIERIEALHTCITETFQIACSSSIEMKLQIEISKRTEGPVALSHGTGIP